MINIVTLTTLGKFQYTVDENDEICIVGIETKNRIGISKKRRNKKISLRIPSKIKGKLVTSIGYKAFHCCFLAKSIKIPKTVTRIGCLAFEDCSSLTKINISNSDVKIGGGVFSECEKLKKVKISNKNYEIVNNVLYDKKEKTVVSCFSE